MNHLNYIFLEGGSVSLLCYVARWTFVQATWLTIWPQWQAELKIALYEEHHCTQYAATGIIVYLIHDVLDQRDKKAFNACQ